MTLTARHYADLARVTGRTEALAAVEQALGADFARDSDRYAHREVIAALLAPWFAEPPDRRGHQRARGHLGAVGALPHVR